MDTRCYGQNSDPIYRGLTVNDSRYYGLSLFLTQNDVLKVSAKTFKRKLTVVGATWQNAGKKPVMAVLDTNASPLAQD